MKRSLLIVIVALAAVAAEVRNDADFGTTAVAVWSPARIVIGVDSHVNSRRGDTVTSSTGCKVRIIGTTVFSAAGFYAHPATGYDLWSTLESVGRRATSVLDAASRVEHEIGPLLTRAVEDAKRKDLERFERDFHSEFLAVAIAGLVHDRPTLVVREFFPDRGHITIERIQEPPENEPAPARTALGVSVMGEHDAIDQAFPKPQLIAALRHDLVGTVKQVLGLQIHATPDKVSGPVTIVEVTPSGARWIEGGACASE